jgi:protein gp37
MAQQSSIEWTEATWNPVTGCTQVSPGCAHCYAKTFAERFRGVPGHPYEFGFDLQLRPERLRQPLEWKKHKTIFVNSMSDLFHEDVPFEFIEKVFETMAEASQHVFQVLTKRRADCATSHASLRGPITCGWEYRSRTSDGRPESTICARRRQDQVPLV